MTRKRLAKIRRELERLRGAVANAKVPEYQAVAKRLGRERVVRGKEPTFERAGWTPLTIPGHPGPLKKGTAYSVLNQLEADADALEAELPEVDPIDDPADELEQAAQNDAKENDDDNKDNNH